MVNLSVSIDASTQAAFEKALDEAIIYNKRSAAEICNSTLFFIVRGAINDTDATTNDTIRNDLLAASRTAPAAPKAALIINSLRGANGELGLNGQEMSEAVERLIKRRQSHKNYIRSRWIQANKTMQSATKYKAGAKKMPAGVTRAAKTLSGGAKPAQPGIKPSGAIWAAIEKLKNADTAGVLLQKGLEQAVREETQSKLEYVIRKKTEEGIIQFNR